MPGIIRQADQYGLDVPAPAPVSEQQVAEAARRSGPRIHAGTMARVSRETSDNELSY